MPAAKKKPSAATADRISPLENGSAHFAFQVGRIDSGFQWAMRRALDRIQREVLADVYTLPITGPAGIRPFAESLAGSVSRKLEQLQPQLVAALETFAMAASEAFPKFLNNATGAVDPLSVSREQFQDDATGRIDSIFDTSFPRRGGDPSSRDDAENEEEEEEEDLWWFWLPMPPQDALRIVAFLIWQQYSIQQLWEAQIERQRRQVLQRLLSEMSLVALNPPDQGLPESAIRKLAAAVISRNIAPSNRPGSPRAPGNAVDSISRVVSTAVWAVANEVISQTLAANATSPGNAAPFGSSGGSPGGSPFGSSGRLNATIGGKTRRVGVYWSVTFDGHNICFKCAALHGKFFPHDANGDKTSPPCPLHGDCRCFLIPGFDSAKNKKREAKSLKQFNQWFGQQSEEFQKGMMGVKRFELWKSGGFSFRDFVEFRNGVPVDIRTLRELGDLFRI